jgi:hypothetical protein
MEQLNNFPNFFLFLGKIQEKSSQSTHVLKSFQAPANYLVNFVRAGFLPKGHGAVGHESERAQAKL